MPSRAMPRIRSRSHVFVVGAGIAWPMDGMFQLLLKGNDLPDRCARLPSHGIRHGGVEGDPSTLTECFQIDVTEEQRTSAVGTGQHEPHRMTDRLEHGAEQDRHVVAVTGAQLQHPARRVQDFHTVRILGVAHIPLHPLKQRLELAEVVLWSHTPCEEDVDRLLPHIEVLRPVTDHPSDVRGRAFRAGIAPGNAERSNAWRGGLRRVVTAHGALPVAGPSPASPLWRASRSRSLRRQRAGDRQIPRCACMKALSASKSCR